MDIVALCVHSGRLQWTMELLGELDKLPPPVQVCVWDNASDERIDLEIEKRFPRVWVTRSDVNSGAGQGYNDILKLVEKEPFDLFIKLDTDTLVRSTWYERTKESVGSWVGAAGMLVQTTPDVDCVRYNRMNKEWMKARPGWEKVLFHHIQGGYTVLTKATISRFGFVSDERPGQYSDVEASLVFTSWGLDLVGLPFVRSLEPSVARIGWELVKDPRIMVIHPLKDPEKRAGFLRRSTK